MNLGELTTSARTTFSEAKVVKIDNEVVNDAFFQKHAQIFEWDGEIQVPSNKPLLKTASSIDPKVGDVVVIDDVNYLISQFYKQQGVWIIYLKTP